MIKLSNLLLALAIILLLQAGLIQSANAAAAPANDAAAEDKARNFFTDLEVIDQNGNKLRFYSDVLKDRVVLISFIFTNCQDYCPMVAKKLTQTRALMADSIKDEVWYISISIDPERDTPEAMKKFAIKQMIDESRWIFLTGKKENLDYLVKKLGQYTQDVESHSTLMLAGNTKTRHWTRVMPMVPAEGIAQQMRALVDETPG